MDTGLRWLGNAVRSLRTFAYGADSERTRVGLALGGGFARGIAHIGVLRALEKQKIPIDVISGTSVGALIAAGYSSGASLDEMERVGNETRFRDFGRWKLSTMGMASNERLEEFLSRFTTAKYFEELKIPLAIVATDLVKGESVYFTEGEIGLPLRASCAYPGLFVPVEYRNRFLVDGFLTEAVPTAAARHLGAELVIAIHLEPGMLAGKPRNTIEVIGRSFSVMQMTGLQPWRELADLVIEPEVHHVLWDGFDKTPQLVAAGEEAMRAAIPQVKDLLSRKSPLTRHNRQRARAFRGD